nr:uncharacterized protein LOC113403281 [Vanessa tameamea]
MLALGNIHCYADDSTVDGGYHGRAVAGRAETEEKRRDLVVELDSKLELIAKWGSDNLVEFNTKNRCGVQGFTPQQLLLLYKMQVRSCVEYCSHLWDGSAKYLMEALDRLQRRAVRIIGDVEVTNTLEPLRLRREIAALSVFYRLYHGECSEELFSLIPASPSLHRSTRAGSRCNCLTVTSIPSRPKQFGNSFLCRTAKKWNSLPAHVFPSSYNLGASNEA